MAQNWQAKAPLEVAERRWSVPLAECDRILTASAVGSGVTVDSTTYYLDEAVVVISAGTAGATATITVTVTTDNGNTHIETFYVAVHETTVQAVTARDVCYFALRKITGNGNDPTSEELDDALGLLRGVLARHGIGPVPLTAQTALNLPDDFISPLEFMLRKLVHSTYEANLTPVDLQMADEGERHITNSLFVVSDLAMPATLTRRTVADFL
jgi:hypothetical protein